MSSPFAPRRAGDHKVLLSVSVLITVVMFVLVASSEQSYLSGQTVGTPTIDIHNIEEEVQVWNGTVWAPATFGAFSSNVQNVTLTGIHGNAKIIDIVTANNSVEVNKLLHNNEVTYSIDLKTSAKTTLNNVFFEMGTFKNSTTNLNLFSSKAIENQVINTTIYSSNTSTNLFGDSEIMSLMNLYAGNQEALPMLMITGNISNTTTLEVTLNFYHTANLDLWEVYNIVLVADGFLMIMLVAAGFPRQHGVS